MHTLRVAFAPIPFAFRRVRERPLALLATTVAFAGATGLIAWSSLAGGLAQERSVRLRLGELPPAERAIRVFAYTEPLETDTHMRTVASALAKFTDVSDKPRRVTIWHPISPPDERGVRLVVPANAVDDVDVTAGRLRVDAESGPVRRSRSPADSRSATDCNSDRRPFGSSGTGRCASKSCRGGRTSDRARSWCAR